MDMRSLDSSLPRASAPKQATAQPSEGLMQAFKSAALTVTTLYKTAAADQAKAHLQGYQEALEDILGLLDRENMGLSEGEGWRVRQWVTERVQGGPAASGPGESEDEVDDTGSRKATEQAEATEAESSPIRQSSPPKSPEVLQSDFTFRSTHPYPEVHDIDSSPVEPPRSFRLELHARPSTRTHNRSNPHRGRRSSVSGLSSGAGLKRKATAVDFFDLTNFGITKDGTNGGSKRGRMA